MHGALRGAFLIRFGLLRALTFLLTSGMSSVCNGAAHAADLSQARWQAAVARTACQIEPSGGMAESIWQSLSRSSSDR